MLIAIPRDASREVNASAVNCAPWSVLKISGRPRLNASSSASWQKLSSNVFDNRQASTYRLTETYYGVSQEVQTSTQGASFPLLPLSE
jgi:hypothetical protein